MRFCLLGPVTAQSADQAIELGRRERLALAYLLLRSDRLTSTDRLIDMLWSDPPRTARQQLHNVIASLRRRVQHGCDELIVTRPMGYELRLGEHQLDVLEFRRHAGRGRDALLNGRYDEAEPCFASALALWRGAAMEDVTGEWADNLRASLMDERVAVAEAWLDCLFELGRHEEVIEAAGPLIVASPYREGLHEHRLRALAASGRRTEALEGYQAIRRTMVDELGIEPGAGLRLLHQRLLDGSDLPPRWSSPPRPRPLEVPPAPYLFGRDELLDQLEHELVPTTEPVVVALTGIGGAGKTSLAVAAAHRVEGRFRGGVLFADLRGSSAHPLVPHEIAARFLRSLGTPADHVPDNPDERLTLYRSTIADSPALVVLDDAGAEAQVRPLLPAAAGCAALVTSRRRLSGLATHARARTIGALGPQDAANLLIASSTRDDITREQAYAAAELCSGLPLALCVAGARLAVSTHVDIAEMLAQFRQEHDHLDGFALGDLDVRAALSTSYDNGLSVGAQDLLCALGLTAGQSWPRWLADIASPENRSLPALEELINVHFVEPDGRDRTGRPRLRMHRLVAEFASERARARWSTTAVRERQVTALRGWHGLAAFCDEQLDHGMDTVHGLPPATAIDGVIGGREHAYDWFQVEYGSLLDAVDRAIALEEYDLAASIALRTNGFLTVKAFDVEREAMLRKCLALPLRTLLRERLLRGLFAVLAQRGRDTELAPVAQQLLTAATEHGDPIGVQLALARCGSAASFVNRFEEATSFLIRAADAAAALNDPGAVAEARGRLAMVHLETGHPSEAEPLLAEVIRSERRLGASRSVAVWLVAHTDCLIEIGRLQDAAKDIEEAHAIAVAIGDEYGQATCGLRRATLLNRKGDVAAAWRSLEHNSPVLDRHAGAGINLDALRLRVDLLLAEGNWASAEESLTALLTARRRSPNTLELARDLARSARLRHAQGDPGAASDTQQVAQILRQLGLEKATLRLPSP
ncbi:AfsR/SARP family transcriptional regulator [Luteipulveratus mongoliensis]|uniref:OmpR/PhoB-type domain-containing protein n=1 Tax=Luteipulveratus mongoliensis TaxID=571913 RepID=A0A0K1JE64_9MICO|nr:AfsR/SARP family transcriptional regulator [Luteipulveratus mongoliensis]AKU15007.1 hypothetical protein VV02_02575 [Luteipulveratus mongoliensis]